MSSVYPINQDTAINNEEGSESSPMRLKRREKARARLNMRMNC
jgi:hypothetical protein